MTDELWKALAGLLAASNTAVIWLLIKAKRNGHASEPPEAILARSLAVTQILEHVDDGERRVHKNVDDTRHSLANAMQEQTAEIIGAIKDLSPRRRG